MPQNDLATQREDIYAPHADATGVTDPGYGWHLVLDLHNCDPGAIDSVSIVSGWIHDLVEHIGMKRYGAPFIAHFGHDDPVTAGLTAIQPIETSNITAHFSPHLRTAHIDVFSCRQFDPHDVVTFCEERFRGSGGRMSFLARG